ncbi:topology modulation protein [Glycomyces buryatensis]|uniref:Topology modulation protein n=1 Tax=Glycomyces buryatensis TaxID=2570927 RepID=A0A4S8QH36_9ACTN|nr:topology modulation protein [Glycomyces buryatensis]THV42512.1 topology modulation protein [Glycomyces buryatensis]
MAEIQRVMIVGCAGAGKTTLAKQLGELLDLPAIHLDLHHFDSDWKPFPREQLIAVSSKFARAERWVIDGNLSSTMPERIERADLVVFLDLSTARCVWNIFKRRWKYGNGQHPSGFFVRLRPEFLRWVLTFRKNETPKLRRLLAEYGHDTRIVTVTSHRQTAELVASLEASLRTGSGPAPE